jgi:hypothetical protein
MPTKLNKRAFEHAKNLISNGKCVKDEKDKWSEHQPSAMTKISSLRKMVFLSMANGI